MHLSSSSKVCQRLEGIHPAVFHMTGWGRLAPYCQAASPQRFLSFLLSSPAAEGLTHLASDKRNLSEAR
jgi:hypothetical protein